MLIFWVVYGLWTVVAWGGVSILLGLMFNSLVKWITDNDYNFDRLFNKLKTVLDIPCVVPLLACGLVYLISHSMIKIIDILILKSQTHSFHEVAVIIAEWCSINMTTPIVTIMLCTGLVLFAKKSYPLFKKVKNAVEKLD